MPRRGKKTKARRKLRLIVYGMYALIAAICAAAFFASAKYSADTNSDGYCSSDIRNSDQSSIDFVSENYSTRIKKGDSFSILIQNERNEYPTTYSIDVSKQGKSALQRSGSLDGTVSLNNYTIQKISTSSLDLADYIIKVKLYHKDKHCLLQLKTYNITVTSTKDLSTIDGEKLFDNGEIVITSLDKSIKTGGIARITIENKRTSTYKYELRVSDAKGNFVLKNNGTINGNSSIGTWATISSAGNHAVEVNIISSENKTLYTERFNVTASDSAAQPVNTGNSNQNSTANNNGAGNIGGSSGNNEVEVGVQIPGSNTNSYSYNSYICSVYKWALNIGFALTLAMFIYAGYRYLTSAGNDAVFKETKDVVTSAILGFLLLLLIRLILGVLNVPEPNSASGKCFQNSKTSYLEINKLG